MNGLTILLVLGLCALLYFFNDSKPKSYHSSIKLKHTKRQQNIGFEAMMNFCAQSSVFITYVVFIFILNTIRFLLGLYRKYKVPPPYDKLKSLL